MFLTPEPRGWRPLYTHAVLSIVIAVVAVVVLTGTLVGGIGPCSAPDNTFREGGRPLPIDPARFALVKVGMPGSQVIEILGLPSESRGPQTEPIQVPPILNPEECSGHIPCQCEGPVTELFYYRGSLGQSLYVYIDRASAVCCYQRSNVMRMSMGSSF